MKSKADRGYVLFTGEVSRPVKALPIKLSPKQSTQDAFRVIARACLHQLCANVGPLRAGDAEGLHQARVAIRRLRAAISLFSELLHDKRTEGIRRDLKWLTDEFGPAREMEVFGKRIVKPASEVEGKTRGVRKLRDDVLKDYDAKFARAMSAIDSARFRALVLDTATWIETGEWMHPDDVRQDVRGQRTIIQTAAEQLNRRRKRLVKRGTHLDTLNPRQRHKLRIAAKKLRYASEFFAGAFPGKKATRRRKRFIDGVKGLQACLGDLNDIAVNKQISASLVKSPAVRERRNDQTWKAFAAGRLSGREEARFPSLMQAAMHAYNGFARAKRFWT